MKKSAILLNDYLRESIRSYRKAHRFSQKSMAAILEISPRSYNDQERGKYGFSAISLVFFMITLPESGVIDFWKDMCMLLKGDRKDAA